MKKHYFFKAFGLTIPFFALLFSSAAYCQEWKWAKYGGSNDDIPGGFYSMPEKVVSMATDPQGNIFALSPVGISQLEIDGVPKESYSSYAGGDATLDYMISSFSCEGELRWAKVIGGPSDDYLKNISTDAMGNVYTSGYLVNTSSSQTYEGIHFDEDQVVEFQGWDTNSQALYLIKYSNDGELEWVRTPQPDDINFVASITQNRNLGVEVDPQGNSYWLCNIGQGTYCNGAYTNSTPGISMHLFKYDTEGNFIEANPVEAEITGYNTMTFKMVRNHVTGVIYLAGYRFTFDDSEYVKVDGQQVTHSMYLAAIDSDGHALWLKENTSTTMSGAGFNDISLDNDGNIYLAGGSIGNDGFGDVTFAPTVPYVYPIAYKLDAEGNTLWGTFANTVAAVNASAVIANGDEVIVTGGGVGVNWSGFEVPLVPNQGYDVFTYKFNAATGQVTGVEVVESNFGSWDYGTALAQSNGNYFLGAQFQYSITLGDFDLFSDTQQSDFVIAKYGDDVCGCNELNPSFTAETQQDGTGFAFEYTGSEEYFTIEWFFGSQGTSTDKNPEFTFAQPGTYEVCVTVSNICGNIESCQQVNVTAGADTFGLANVKVYPNPANGFVTIDSKEALSYEIYSVLGSKVLTGNVQEGVSQVSLQGVAVGVYIIKLENTQGIQSTQKLIIE